MFTKDREIKIQYKEKWFSPLYVNLDEFRRWCQWPWDADQDLPKEWDW